MRSNAKRIAAMTLAVMMSLSALPGLAGEYSSGTLNVKDRVKQPTPAPTEVVETPEEKENSATPLPQATEAPTATPYVFSPWSGWIDASEASNYVATVCASPNGSLVGQIRRGEAVNVVEEDGGWLRIEGAVSGWVMSRYVSDTKPAEIEPEATEEPVIEEPTEPEATEEPVVEEPTEPEATEEPVIEEPTEPEATDGLEATAEPEVTPEPTATPVPMVTVVPEVDILFERDAEGNLVLDENGDPIAYVRGDLGAPLNFERDAEGNLVLDENGNPAFYIMVEATEEPAVEETVEPEATEEPVVEETAEPEATVEPEYMVDEEGNLILDENGNPIPVVEETAEPEYMVDENGNLILDENGNPIPVTEEAVEEEAPAVQNVYPLLGAEESELLMYAEASFESEVIAAIPAGGMAQVVELGAEWSIVQYGEFTGYVPTAKIVLYNADVTEEEQAIVRTITVSSNLYGQEIIYEGTEVILTATLTGFEDVNYQMQWQYSADGGATILDVEGANDYQYSYPITIENAHYLWRLSVTILE